VSKARLIITAVIVERRSQAQVARDYSVSEGWVSKLVARYRAEGETAFEPRSRRPLTRPGATPTTTVELVVAIRRRLTAKGFDAGPDTIVWHLEHHHQIRLSRATVYRILRRANVITPEPKKKPKTSYVRFEADQPNECWQADFTHWRLANGTDVEILCWIDDHSRYALSVTAHYRVTGRTVVDTFRTAIHQHGVPLSTLTDNGMVFTTRLSGGQGGRNMFEAELVQLRVIQKNSRPNHPTTCGKVERFHETLKKNLRSQPPPTTITDVQTQLNAFIDDYNHDRPHRSLQHRATPATIYTTRPKATPGQRDDPHHRVRHDRITDGRVSLRVNGEMHHIGLGRTLDGTRVILLIADLDVRVIHATTGEIIRTLTIDPERRYHGTGKPPGGPKRPYGPHKNKRSEPK
jgi:transposase InsO family protein